MAEYCESAFDNHGSDDVNLKDELELQIWMASITLANNSYSLSEELWLIIMSCCNAAKISIFFKKYQKLLHILHETDKNFH